MSDRDEFEKWAKGKLDLQHIGVCYGDDITEAAFSAWQAAQAQAPEPVAVADKGVINWIDGKQFDHEADLYTQPAVNQQLMDKETLCALFNHYHALAYNPKSEHYRAEHFYKAAIAAAQEQK